MAVEVGEGGVAVGWTVLVGVGVKVEGTAVGVEPEQAATNIAAADKTRVEARGWPLNFARRREMLTSILRPALRRRMYPVAPPPELPPELPQE